MSARRGHFRRNVCPMPSNATSLIMRVIEKCWTEYDETPAFDNHQGQTCLATRAKWFCVTALAEANGRGRYGKIGLVTTAKMLKLSEVGIHSCKARLRRFPIEYRKALAFGKQFQAEFKEEE